MKDLKQFGWKIIYRFFLIALVPVMFLLASAVELEDVCRDIKRFIQKEW